MIWPETSIPFILTQNPDALGRIAEALEDGQILIAGAVRTENDGAGTPTRYYNSAYMIDSQGQIVGASDKVHLVPFGEYLPLEEFWNRLGLTAIAAFPGGYSAAPRYQHLTAPDGTRFLPLICYEVIFPTESAARSQHGGRHRQSGPMTVGLAIRRGRGSIFTRPVFMPSRWDCR